MSNDLLERDRWQFGPTTIPRHGYIVVFADGHPERGPLHAGFTLAAGGGAAVLSAPDGKTTGGLTFGAQEADKSFGYTWSAGAYVPLPEASPAAENETEP